MPSGTRCRGDAHGLDDRQMMPMASMLSNSALAAANLSGGRRRACEWIGGPLVTMKCSTPCLIGAQVKLGVVMSGNAESSMSYWSVEFAMALR